MVKRSDTRAAIKPAKPARPAKPATPAKPAKPAMPAKPVKPTVPTKVQANGKPTTTFKGRPTGNVQTVAARVKQLNLRVRGDADIDGLAARLRATPDAVRQWLDNRNGSRPAATDKPAKVTKSMAKTTTKAPAKTVANRQNKPKAEEPKEPKAPTIMVGHVWEGPTPDGLPELKGCTLAVRYTVQLDDGLIVSQLWGIRDKDGQHITDAWQWPLDFRPKAETSSRGRKVTLKDRTKAGLQAWLAREGLTDK
jgi:hypothetical protein